MKYGDLMKIEIITESNFKEIENFLENYEKKLKELGSDEYGIYFYWNRVNSKKILLIIEKEGLNKIMENIIKNTIKSQLKKINPKIKVN